MEQVSLFFSLLFFSVFTVYLFWYTYFFMDPRAILNKLLLLTCISLCLWSLGLSVANTASNMESCLFWRRVSAVGWGSFFSIMLHFILALTSPKYNLRQNKSHLLLYLPAIISLYAFALSNQITATQYNLVQMDYGWVNVAAQNGWTVFPMSTILGMELPVWCCFGCGNGKERRRGSVKRPTSFLLPCCFPYCWGL